MYKILNNSVYFELFLKALYECFLDLQIQCELVTEVDHTDNYNVYIICTTHENRPLPNRYISYNLEQLTVTRDTEFDSSFYAKLRRAEFVLDYSIENIKYLKEHDITAHHLPIGYHDSYVINRNTIEKPYLFMFLGTMNERRQYFITKCMFTLYKYINQIFIHSNKFGKDYDDIVLKSRASLNIHFYDGKTILEVTRILPLIANKVLVLSERSNDVFYDRALCTCITWFNENNLTNQMFSVRDLTNEEVERISTERYEFIKTHFNFIDFVSKVKHLFVS